MAMTQLDADQATRSAFDDATESVKIKATSAAPVITPTISTSAYTSGMQLGGVQTLTGVARANGTGAILQSLCIVDKANQKSAMDLIFLSASPAGTAGDHTTAATLGSASTTIVGFHSIAAADWTTMVSQAVVNIGGIAKAMMCATGSKDLYVLAIVRGTPTYTASALQFTYNFLQD